MTLLQAYLASPRTRLTLAKRRGNAGFSLIELVVVVAVLAVLAAIALPNFLSVNKDAQISSAKNTLATIIKECSVKEARVGSGTIGTTSGTGTTQPIQSASANLNGYAITTSDSPSSAVIGDKIIIGTTATGTTCYTVTAFSKDGKLPNFTIKFDAQAGTTTKTCHGKTTATYLTGCNTAAGETVANASTTGEW